MYLLDHFSVSHVQSDDLFTIGARNTPSTQAKELDSQVLFLSEKGQIQLGLFSPQKITKCSQKVGKIASPANSYQQLAALEYSDTPFHVGASSQGIHDIVSTRYGNLFVRISHITGSINDDGVCTSSVHDLLPGEHEHNANIVLLAFGEAMGENDSPGLRLNVDAFLKEHDSRIQKRLKSYCSREIVDEDGDIKVDNEIEQCL